MSVSSKVLYDAYDNNRHHHEHRKITKTLYDDVSHDYCCFAHKCPQDHQRVLTLQHPEQNEWLKQGLVGPLSQVVPQHLKREFNKINASSSLRWVGKSAFLWPFDSAWCQKWFSNLHQWRIWQFWSSSGSSTMSERIKDNSKCNNGQGPREAQKHFSMFIEMMTMTMMTTMQCVEVSPSHATDVSGY